MNPELVAQLEEIAALERKLKAERAASELEKYWYEVAPFGQNFDPVEATKLLLAMVKRYEAALCKIALESEEQRPGRYGSPRLYKSRSGKAYGAAAPLSTFILPRRRQAADLRRAAAVSAQGMVGVCHMAIVERTRQSPR